MHATLWVLSYLDTYFFQQNSIPLIKIDHIMSIKFFRVTWARNFCFLFSLVLSLSSRQLFKVKTSLFEWKHHNLNENIIIFISIDFFSPNPSFWTMTRVRHTELAVWCRVLFIWCSCFFLYQQISPLHFSQLIWRLQLMWYRKIFI